MASRHRFPFLLLAISCAMPHPALAWSHDAHRAIVKTAMRLAPALESRFPATSRDAFWELLAAADPLDETCLTHRDFEGAIDAAPRAARLLADIRTGRVGKTPRQRAAALGRFLHYVTDCAVPRAAVGQAMEQTGDGDWVVFRVPRPIVEPIEEALRARAEETFWADDTPSSGIGPGFRAAVNLVLDVAPLLPPWDPAAAVPASFDATPALLVANRWVVPLGKVQKSIGSVGRDFSSNSLMAKVLKSAVSRDVEQVPLLSFPGVSVVEWSRAADSRRTRLLLANAADVCAFGIRVSSGEFQKDLDASLPPRTLKIVEIDGPERTPVTMNDVKLEATFGACVEDAGPRPVPIGWRLVCSSPGRWPDLDNAVEERLPELPPLAADRVPFALGATIAPGGVELGDVTYRLGPAGWQFEAEITNSGDFKARPLTVEVEMSFEGSSRPSERRTLVYNLADLRRGQTDRFTSVVTARAAERAAKPRFRIVSVRQAEAAPPPKREVTLGME